MENKISNKVLSSSEDIENLSLTDYDVGVMIDNLPLSNVFSNIKAGNNQNEGFIFETDLNIIKRKTNDVFIVKIREVIDNWR
jgi:hypothetical protein